MTKRNLMRRIFFICTSGIEFRGIRKTKDIIRQTTEAALSSYRYADHTAEVFRSPIMAFACYVGSHWDRADYGKDGHSI